MKITRLLLIMFLMSSVLMACGKNENSGENVTSEKQDKVEMEQEEVKNDSSYYEKNPELPGILEVNLSTAKYCVDAPDVLIRSANTGFINEMNSYFVIYDQYLDTMSEIEFGVDVTIIKEPQDVIENMEAQMIATCKNGLIFADEYDVEVISEESVKVNSWDMCKIKGVINLACEWTLDYDQVDFVAYSVIKDGYPVYFAVVEDPLGEETIDLEEMADKIAKTFRDNPES